MGQGSLGIEAGVLCSHPQVPGSPEADFHLAGADLPPAAGDPGAAPRPAQRDTGGQAGAAGPTGQVFSGREKKGETLGCGLLPSVYVLGMSGLLVALCRVLCTPRSDIHTHVNIKMETASLKIGLLWRSQ